MNMEINAYFTVKALIEGTCTTIDFSHYSYVMKLCKASGAQDIIHRESEVYFSQGGESLLHCIPYEGGLAETPLVYCDLFCAGICTDKNILINSFSNASNTNNWTVFNKKLSRGETTKNQRFDKICAISEKRIFIDPQFPIGHPKDPFEKSKIERQLAARLRYEALESEYMINGYPDQGEASLCGPAVFFYVLLKDDPASYCQVIKDLWNDGRAMIGDLKVIPSKWVCNPKNYTSHSGETRVPAIDWISMASLRDNENIFFDYSSPDQQFSGLTMPEGIAKWAQSMGATVIYRDMSLFSWSVRKVIELSDYVSPTTHVAVLINHGLIYGGESGFPSHWIVLEEKLQVVGTSKPIDQNTSPDTQVDVELFSWAERKKMSKFYINRTRTLKDLCSYVYGAVVFEKF